MTKSKYFPYILLFLIFFSFVSASAKDAWVKVESKNFHLIGNAGEKDIRKVATKLEQFRETFRLLFSKTNLTSPIPTNVVVFKSSSAYKPFKPKRADGKIDDFVAGFFQPGRDVNYITLSTEGNDADTFGTIFHEYIHFMLDINFGKSTIPAWFNEGLAEYYQTFEIENDQKVKLGIFQQGHIDLLSQNRLMPLDTLFNVTNYQLLQQGNHSRSIFYAQSWALVHYLLQHNQGEKNVALAKFINLLINKVPPEKAFQDSFGMTYAQMEKELKRYVNQNTYYHQVFSFSKKLVFDTEMKVSPLSEADSNAYLGDLLLHMNRADDAEPYLRKAIALEPNSSLANTALGMVKFRQRKFDEAKRYLETAISGDSKNPFALYNYAYLLSREEQDEFGFVASYSAEKLAKMRDALKKAIALNPAYAESYGLLAFISLVNNSELDEAVALLKKSLTYQPNDQHSILRIGEIYARQEKFAEAREIAEKISRTASESDVKSRAEMLLDQVTTQESIAARNEALRKEFEERKKNYETGNNRRDSEPEKLTRRQPEISPEEIAERTERTNIYSINQVIRKPREGEKQIIGKITKIACVQNRIVYTVKTEGGTVTLFSKDFQDLVIVSFDPKAAINQVGCDSSFPAFNAVLTYKVSSAKSLYSGELVGIDFVPANFQFMAADDPAVVTDFLAGTPDQTPPPPDSDSTIIVSENMPPEDFEQKRREAMMKSLKNAMRKPRDGENRIQGMLEKIECDSKAQYFVFKSGDQFFKLKADQNLQIMAFTPDAGGFQFQCGMKQFNVNAVITFKPNSDKKSKYDGDLVTIEFVPNSFKLDQ